MKNRIIINGQLYEAVESMNESKWHDFTKYDWYSYAGAAKLPDGSEPKIYSKNFSDEVGVDVILSGEDYDRYGRYNDNYSTCDIVIDYYDENDPDDDSVSWTLGGLSQRKAFRVYDSIISKIDSIDDIDEPDSVRSIIDDIVMDYGFDEVR